VGATHLRARPNRTLYLVEVADRVLVLGATGTSLTTLSEIREPEAIDLLKKRADGEAEEAEAPSFAAQFKAMTEQTPLGDKIGALRTLAAGLRRPAVETVEG
jgi:flagellar biogenesis protein FliO